MTALEIKNFFRSTLLIPRTRAQELSVLDAIIDFINVALTTGIPDWTNVLTFKLDGSGAGAFTIYPDTNGKVRFWKTKVDNNIGNAPPTNPIETENVFWIEVSPSDGSAIKEWTPGIYGAGLVIVFYDITGTDPSLYKLTVATRPFYSTNFAVELAAGKWKKMSDVVNVQNGIYTSCVITGVNVYEGTLEPALTAYVKGQVFDLTDVLANTVTNPNINLGGGIKNILDYKGNALAIGSFVGNVTISYDGVAFRMIGGGGGGTAATTTFSPTSNIVSTNVQAAIEELDQEKQVALGFTPENVANKENILLDTSTIKYPTNNIVKAAIDLKAPLSSPTLTGIPIAPTAAVNTSTTQIATTQFVQVQIANESSIANVAAKLYLFNAY